MNLAEKFFIEMSKTERRELQNRLFVLITHLLKIEYVTDEIATQNQQGWNKTVRAQRRELVKLLRRHPSLKADLTDRLVDDVHVEAVMNLEEEYSGLPFPPVRQLSIQDILHGYSA